VQVLQLVEALPVDLQAERRTSSVNRWLTLSLNVTRWSFSSFITRRSKHHLFPSRVRNSNSSPGRCASTGLSASIVSGHNGNDVIGAGLAAREVDNPSPQVDDLPRQVGQLAGAVPAVEGQQDHRAELHPRGGVDTAVGSSLLVGGVEDEAQLVGRVQPPTHLRGRATRQASDQRITETHRPAPSHIGGVSRGGAQVADRALGEVCTVLFVEPVVNLLGGVGRHVVATGVAGEQVDPLAAELVLLEGAAAELAPLSVAAAVDDPQAKNITEERIGRRRRASARASVPGPT
jgi:hypothetical protein